MYGAGDSMKQLTISRNYSLKVATPEDNQDAIFALIKEAFEYHSLGIRKVDTASVFRLMAEFEDVRNQNDMVMILMFHKKKLVGFLAGQKNMFMKQLTGKDVASVIVWYVKPAYRNMHSLKLLEAFEMWAKMNMCEAVHSACPTAEPTDIIYTRKNYKPLEITYRKEL